MMCSSFGSDRQNGRNMTLRLCGSSDLTLNVESEVTSTTGPTAPRREPPAPPPPVGSSICSDLLNRFCRCEAATESSGNERLGSWSRRSQESVMSSMPLINRAMVLTVVSCGIQMLLLMKYPHMRESCCNMNFLPVPWGPTSRVPLPMLTACVTLISALSEAGVNTFNCGSEPCHSYPQGSVVSRRRSQGRFRKLCVCVCVCVCVFVHEHMSMQARIYTGCRGAFVHKCKKHAIHVYLSQ